MQIDFSQLPLQDRAFSTRPMTFCDADPKNALSAIFDMLAVETGNRKSREIWQAAQLQNLLDHAAKRSGFWRQRIGKQGLAGLSLASLPVLTRAEIIKQVETEGALLNATDRIGVKSSVTSGSSGTPVKFFASEMNIRYNHIRSTAQYFLEQRDFALNRIACVSHNSAPKVPKVTKNESWLGPLSPFLKSGFYKYIEYRYANIAEVRAELEREPIGYLICTPWVADEMVQSIDPAALKRAGMKMWLCLSGSPDPELRDAFSTAGIPTRATYSAEETGPIGYECPQTPGHYHVATSNVFVEVSADDAWQVDGRKLGRVLVTHLHSYATPVIRYDLGDVGALAPQCSCGHDGPTLSHIHGRSKNLLKHADGTVSGFYVTGQKLAAIGKFTEFRIRQTGLNSITLELGGRKSLEPKETEEFVNFLKIKAGDDFTVDVRPVAEIDWGHSTKRLAFHNPLL